MVWVYSDPLTKVELEVQSFLEKTLKKRKYLFKIVKLLSVLNYLKSNKFTTVNQLRNDIFLDKYTPLFDEETASQVFKALYGKKGGGEYPFTENLIRRMGSYLKSKDPIGISGVFETGLWVISLPVKMTKSVLGEGVYKFASGTVHGLIETGVSGVNGIAETAAGPIGLAVVALFTAIAAAAGATISIAEDQFSQAVVHALNFIPGVGPALVKGINKTEHLAKVVDNHREEIDNIPFGQYITYAIPKLESEQPATTPAAGGLRRRKTRRNMHRLKLAEKKTKRVRSSH